MTRNYLSGSIKKALAIIECVGKSPKPLKASQVASITKLDRATAFRILTYLTSLGYIFKDTSNNLYSLGHKIFEFGDKSDFLKTLTTLCFEYIKNLSYDTNHITYLAVLEGPHIVYCDKVDPLGENAPRAFRNNEIPVFWACGVTPQSVLENSKPDFCITHSPGKMLITDKLNNDLAAL